MTDKIQREDAEPSLAPPGDAAGAPLPAELEEAVVAALRTVFDPEIPVNIYEMGLIYDLSLVDANKVLVKMTLTSPACPVAGSLPGDVQTTVESVDGVSAAEVDLVWDPTWNPSMMSEAAKLELGML